MDISSIMTTLLSSDSVKNLSKKTGSSQKDVTNVLTSALPLLLDGANGQAKDESTAESFVKALAKHGDNDTSDIAGFLGNVDMEDGAKIIGHLLGAGTESTTKKVSKASGASSDSTAQIMSAAAPLLMSLLGQETKQERDNGDIIADVIGSVIKNVDVGSLVMGMLGGDNDSKTTTKKSTSKKTTTKKTTTKKSTAKKSTAKKKAADSDDGIDIGDVADLLTKLLK